MEIVTTGVEETFALGKKLGKSLHGGEVIELVGDIGAGKTALTKGIAKGMGVDDDVQSPTFTISRLYEGRNRIRLAHYDFYRLQEAGIMNAELSESVHDPETVTIVEWAEIVEGVLPEDRTQIVISSPTESTRVFHIKPSTSLALVELLS
jgi:tRNA threonylcarbamoyladenosine biosynthesis protein TsaE